MQLYAGDRIAIKSSFERSKCANEPSIIVNLAGKPVVLNEGNTPFTVKATRTGKRSLLGNFVRWFGNILGEGRRPVVQAKSRGGNELTFLVVDRSGAKMAAGKRSLHLAWRGGKGPYTVVIRGARGIVQSGSGIAGYSHDLPEHEWGNGEYLISVADSKGEQIDIPLDIVDRHLLPRMPNEYAQAIENSHFDESAKATLYAAWLGYLPDGWAWEAYQQTFAMESDFLLANELRQTLEETTPQERAGAEFL
jgi:hypothetical protein